MISENEARDSVKFTILILFHLMKKYQSKNLELNEVALNDIVFHAM